MENMTHPPAFTRRQMLSGALAAAAMPVLWPARPAQSATYLPILSAARVGGAVSLYSLCDRTKLSGIRDFTSTYDVSRAVQDAVINGVGRIAAEHGLFNFETSVVMDRPLTIEGQGERTVFNQRSITDKATFKFQSSARDALIERVAFTNFTLRSDVGSFSEYQHFVELSGAANALFDGMRFIGFRGDAIYLGSGVGREQRHNKNVTVTRSLFDGVNWQNRNAISVIDVDGMVIDGNTFRRCSRPNMPGPVDFEPNANPWHVVQGIRVRNNVFESNGGNVGEVSFFAPAAVKLAPRDIEISGNRSKGYKGTGSFLAYDANRAFAASSPDTGLRATGNIASGGNRPFSILNGKKVALDRNQWTDFAQGALVGFRGKEVRGMTVNDRFTRVGHVGGAGLIIFNADGLDLAQSEFADCGTGKPAASNAIQFNEGRSRGIILDGIQVTSPTGKTLVAVERNPGHIFTPATNRLRGARIGKLPSRFKSEER